MVKKSIYHDEWNWSGAGRFGNCGRYIADYLRDLSHVSSSGCGIQTSCLPTMPTDIGTRNGRAGCYQIHAWDLAVLLQKLCRSIIMLAKNVPLMNELGSIRFVSD